MTARVPRTHVTLTCRRCGMSWRHLQRGGSAPKDCPECRTVRATPQVRRDVSDGAVPHLALAVTQYRLAIEMATAALRLGRPRLALEHLEAVQAPTR